MRKTHGRSYEIIEKELEAVEGTQYVTGPVKIYAQNYLQAPAE